MISLKESLPAKTKVTLEFADGIEREYVILSNAIMAGCPFKIKRAHPHYGEVFEVTFGD